MISAAKTSVGLKGTNGGMWPGVLRMGGDAFMVHEVMCSDGMAGRDPGHPVGGLVCRPLRCDPPRSDHPSGQHCGSDRSGELQEWIAATSATTAGPAGGHRRMRELW